MAGLKVTVGCVIVLVLLLGCNGYNTQSSSSSSTANCDYIACSGDADDINFDGSCVYCQTCSCSNNDCSCTCPSSKDCDAIVKVGFQLTTPPF